MVGSPLIAHPGDQDYQILHVPNYRQPQDSSECIYYALWIATQYLTNKYPSKDVRDAVSPPKLDQIADHIETGSRGWQNPKQDPLSALSSQIGGIKLKLQYRYNGFPVDVDEFVQDSLDCYLPTVILIDRLLLTEGDRNEGIVHAVVVCGIGNSHVTIEDPLVEGTKTVPIQKLNDAWDPEYNTAIEIELKTGLQPVRRSNQ